MKQATRSSLSLAAVIIAAAAVTGCGSSSTTTTSREPAVELPKVPEVDPNRPKTGRAALFNVPWTPKGGYTTAGDFIVKNYIVITEDEMKHVALCGAKIAGEWQWVQPEAVSQIVWPKKGSFLTKESDSEVGKIGERKCTASVDKDMTYFYKVENNGESLGLITKTLPPVATAYEILRN